MALGERSGKYIVGLIYKIVSSLTILGALMSAIASSNITSLNHSYGLERSDCIQPKLSEQAHPIVMHPPYDRDVYPG